MCFNSLYSRFLGVRFDIKVCEEREEENTEEEDEEDSWDWVGAGGEQRNTSMQGEGHELEQLHL